MSLRDDILGIKDCAEKIIDVPEWGGIKVLVKAFTAGQKNSIWDACTTVTDGEAKVDSNRMMILNVIGSAHDPETGKKIFKAGDFEAVVAKSAGAIERIARAARELSGSGDKALEDAEKN